jgi:Fusaric acid resistance protein-like
VSSSVSLLRQWSGTRSLIQLDRNKIDWGIAGRSAVLLAIPVLIATTTDLVVIGVFVAIGCLNVLLLQIRARPEYQLRRSAWGMVLNSGAIAMGTLVGTLGWSEVPLVAIGLIAIYLVNRIPHAGSLPMTVSVLFVIGVGLPGPSPEEAGVRALLVLLGGGLGFAGLVVHLAGLRAWGPSRTRVVVQPGPPGTVATPESPTTMLPGWEISVAAGITAAAGLALALGVGLARDYWIMLTVIVILRASVRETGEIGFERMVGTVLGAALSIGITLGVPDPPVQGAILVFLAFWTFALLRANYTGFAVAITAFIIVLLNLVYAGGIRLAETRVLDTFIGGILALTAATVLWLLWERKLRQSAPPGSGDSSSA